MISTRQRVTKILSGNFYSSSVCEEIYLKKILHTKCKTFDLWACKAGRLRSKNLYHSETSGTGKRRNCSVLSTSPKNAAYPRREWMEKLTLQIHTYGNVTCKCAHVLASHLPQLRSAQWHRIVLYFRRNMTRRSYPTFIFIQVLVLFFCF